MEVTRRLVEVEKIIGIDVIDHIIVGNNTFTSLKEKGYI
ncbi:JAB domain-containing protein [Bacillus thuringiensis]